MSDRLIPEEKEIFGVSIKEIDWRHYWADIHMVGLHKWVFGELDDRLRQSRKLLKHKT